MNSSLLQGLNEKEKELFLAVFTETKIAKNQIIKKEGDSLEKAFFLIQGELTVLKSSSEEDMQVAVITGGEDVFFSISCMLHNGTSLTTVRATKESVILEVVQKDFFDFCQKNPQIGVKILINVTQTMTRFLKKSDEKIAEMYKTLEEVL